MDSKPTFSVIIPSFNRSRTLRRCFDSLASQTFQDFEVILCDDGSTDNTKELFNSYPFPMSARYFHLQHSGRPAIPRNLGISQAKAEWICFLDSDDWWLPNKLQTIVNKLSNNDVIYHDLQIFTGTHFDGILRGRHLRTPVLDDLLCNRNGILTSSCAVRKSKLLEVGIFSNIPVEDLDLWLKLSHITDNFYYIPEVLGTYTLNTNGTNISLNPDSLLSELEIVKHHYHFAKANNHSQIWLAWFYQNGRTLHRNGEFSRAIRCYMQYLKKPKISMLHKLCFALILAILHVRG